MGKPTGFLEIDRQDRTYAPAGDRVLHFKEFINPLPESELMNQAARCMDCGIPFCHKGCPVNNQIPDWNDLVYDGDWETASRNLHSTNNFPEFTGRICPAPCEEACTLNIEDVPVTIKTIECAIVDRAWEEGWITPLPPAGKNGKRVAVVGAGPAGMAASQQLARAGYNVHLFEKNAKPGGLLRYGIPDFKMEKYLIDRRAAQMETEGVKFRFNVEVGVDKKSADLLEKYDAVLLTGGAECPNDFLAKAPGRHLDGVHFAMDFLTQQNRRNSDEPLGNVAPISAKGKHVVVIGGGDTGSDCIGTSFRQGAVSVTQLEIMAEPPKQPDKALTWPHWPLKFRTSSSQAEGATRDFSVNTTGFEGEDGKVTALNYVKVDERFQPIEGTEGVLKADLVLFATGFSGPRETGMLEELGVTVDRALVGRGVKADDTGYLSDHPSGRVFVAGDMRRGQSLVVWAIREGRQAAHAVDAALMGTSELPR